MTEKQNKWKEALKKVGKGVLKYGLPAAALAGQTYLAVKYPITLCITVWGEFLGTAWFILRAMDKYTAKKEQEELEVMHTIARKTARDVDDTGTIIQRAKKVLKETTGEEFNVAEILQR